MNIRQWVRPSGVLAGCALIALSGTPLYIASRGATRAFRIAGEQRQ